VLIIILSALTMGSYTSMKQPSGKPSIGELNAARVVMVKEQLVGRNITDMEVLSAMRQVRRHEFIPDSFQREAYEDYPLSIGQGQTISQPYIVAKMTELLEPSAGDKILEIGTGSGYQAAVLAEIVEQVYTIEIVEALAAEARQTLEKLRYTNIEIRSGDGYVGWPEHAPFDGIIVTAAPPEVPGALLDQLKVGAHLVIPVGRAYQELKVYTKTESGIESRSVFPVRFVPMTGEAQE